MSNATTNVTDHLWLHFTRMSSYAHTPPAIIERGEGAYIWDSNGKRYLDGLSGLFVVQAGHGRREIAEAMAKQAEKLAYFPICSTSTKGGGIQTVRRGFLSVNRDGTGYDAVSMRV